MNIKSTITAISLLMVAPTFSAQAATLSSVTCSLTSLVLTFDSALSAGDVTAIEIGETSTPKIKYELDLLPGTISGTTLTLTPDATAKAEIRKVSPYKAHIFATGTASGTQKCND